MNSLKEVWKDIESYEGLYQVSNLGNVKSLGNCKSRKEKILKAIRNKDGYLTVILSKHGKVKKLYIHRLVASAFIPNPLNLPQVNHRTEDKTINVVDCLEWCTREYNLNYGTRNERAAKTNTNGKCSKKVLQYSLDGEIIKEWKSVREVERQLGFSKGNISYCCNGKKKSAYGFIWRYE